MYYTPRKCRFMCIKDSVLELDGKGLQILVIRDIVVHRLAYNLLGLLAILFPPLLVF